MLSAKWNTMNMKILYILVVLIGLILIFHSGGYEKDCTKPSLFHSAWELVGLRNELKDADMKHLEAVMDYIEKRQNANIPYSELGKVLFLNEEPPPPRNKNYKILLYKIGKDIEDRHLYYFQGTRFAPFEFCPVKNCILSYNETDLKDADAVLFQIQIFGVNDYFPPTKITRPPGQRWVFISDESPPHTFTKLMNHEWQNYSGVFNWSMMYRLESDIPVAHGRVVPRETPLEIPENLDFKEKFELLVPNAEVKRRDVLVAIMSTTCWLNRRREYVNELQKYMKVDFYGRCAPEELKKLCPWKGFGSQCEHLKKYLFYLSFENSNCNGYMTEKVYTHALAYGNVPIFAGMYKNQSDLLVPPGSYLHVDDFKNPEELARFIFHINATLEENYLKYHEWRKHFKSLSEDGYMGSKSYHYCRVCEALNYNDEKPKVYYKEDLAVFLDRNINCHDWHWSSKSDPN